MTKIVYILVALLVLAGCGQNRVDKVQLVDSNNKVVDPIVVSQSSSGPNSPNIVRGDGKAVVTYVPGAGGFMGLRGGTNTVNLPPGQRFMYIIPKSQTKEFDFGRPDLDMYVTRDLDGHVTSPSRYTVWQAGTSPHSWEAVLYIKEN
jgi:hypothetical protein